MSKTKTRSGTANLLFKLDGGSKRSKAKLNEAFASMEAQLGSSSIPRSQTLDDDEKREILETMKAIIDGNDVFAVMPPTTWRCLCYEVTALADSKITVVISPWIAVMYEMKYLSHRS